MMGRISLRIDVRVPQDSPIRPLPPVSTTDVLKAIALGLILIDHIGHYLADDWPMLRVIGRLGVPVFFFLIGFATSRDIPWRWLAIGVVLTGVDILWLGGLDGVQLNILFNFAAIRLALPLIERHALEPPWRLPLLMLGLVAVMPLINPVLEYGTEGWLFAIFGLLVRRERDGRMAAPIWPVPVAGLLAFGVYAVVESIDYSFSTLHSLLLLIGLAGLAYPLLRFERRLLAWQPGPAGNAVMRFCGRFSLEIYAAQIIVLAAVGGLWSTLDPDEGEDDV
jgi:peptidoglycan/LPS O-acetylase OafA/YrhL